MGPGSDGVGGIRVDVIRNEVMELVSSERVLRVMNISTKVFTNRRVWTAGPSRQPFAARRPYACVLTVS